ncbi:MAG: hypothetical protein HYS32_03535 [Candidatus Woesearchaeota archaeon]|nr:MAG: hypothetical protein HYS32_03535 [Candidatus Woesearchaeota archaeon]
MVRRLIDFIAENTAQLFTGKRLKVITQFPPTLWGGRTVRGAVLGREIQEIIVEDLKTLEEVAKEAFKDAVRVPEYLFLDPDSIQQINSREGRPTYSARVAPVYLD